MRAYKCIAIFPGTATLAAILFSASFFSGTNGLYAQKKPSVRKELKRRHNKFEERRSQDSVWEKDLKITDTTSAKVISKIEDINNTLSDFNDVVENGYDSSDITEGLPGYESRIKFFQVSLSNAGNNLNLSRIYAMQNSLADMKDDLQAWQQSLIAYYTELVGMNAQMRSVLADSSIQSMPNDSVLRQLYLRQINELKKRTHGTDTMMKKNLVKIDMLQSKVSNDYLAVAALQKQIKGLVKTYRIKAFSNEAGYLWNGPSTDTTKRSLNDALQISLKRGSRVLNNYLAQNWDKYIFNLPVFLVFFLWTFINIQKIKKTNPAFLNTLKYIQQVPFLASLVIMLIIAPYLELQHPPAVYIIMLQLSLNSIVTILLAQKWPRKLFFYWLLFFALFIFFAAKSLLISSTYSLRTVSFFVTVASVFLGQSFIKQTKRYRQFFPRYFSLVIWIYILLNALSAGFNLFGRTTLAHISETTAILSYIEAIGLVIFIQAFLDAVKLQLEADKKSTRFTAYLDYQNVALRLRRLLTVVAAISWFISLAQNLNVFDAVYDYIADLMGTERTVGNTSFSIGSIVIFFFVIWIANFFQKYIGYFFGDTGNEDVVSEKKTKLGTSILLIRLLILTAGFFLGILASGIPIDKVTIVIGALGVGIGLGLQSIVNNLVSGVILAIERPIQVGDIIDIGGNTGRVKEIGLRSSRMVTPDGAEVIIPNGDMLSQKLTNWTLNNTHMRIELNFKLQDNANVSKAKEIITKIFLAEPEVLKSPEPQFLIKNMSQAGAELQLFFWAEDINNGAQLKSDITQKIFDDFASQNINVG
ncbi:MAG: mechanosensitive ion channel [Bacteroidetes bacterium]|nr:mechanosensitive ion channel [Bacteroidota bacterium]MBS1972738.1 mechanosensitive ion channel [Bacteroidota bacterium]